MIYPRRSRTKQKADSRYMFCATPSGPLRGRFPISVSNPGFDEYIEPWALEYNPFGVDYRSAIYSGTKYVPASQSWSDRAGKKTAKAP
jgi:hypothetical protein